MRFHVTAAVLTLAAAVLLVPTSAAAGRRGDALSGAARAARKAFRSDAKAADAVFANAVGLLQKGLASGATSAEQAASGFGDALAFYAATLRGAASDATESFGEQAVALMQSSGDDEPAGALAGDGGSFDTFADALLGDIDAFRAKARKRAQRFAAAMARDGGARVATRVALGDWTVDRKPVPTIDGLLPERPSPVRMWGAVATRLTDGRVIMTVFGSAPPELDEHFDVRLEGALVRPVGAFLADGGMAVGPDGSWVFTGEVGDPFAGDGVAVGNRQVHFGLDPEDQGLAGIQPRRLQHAGAISIP